VVAVWHTPAHVRFAEFPEDARGPRIAYNLEMPETRFLSWLFLPLSVAAVACGGSTFTEAPAGAAGTGGTSAGPGAGGNNAGGTTAGSSNAGGSNAGGSTAGSNAGGNGTGGFAGGGVGPGGSNAGGSNAGGNGTGGSNGGTSGNGPGGQGGSGVAGQGGGGPAGAGGTGFNCCTDDLSCGEAIYQNCVNGVCKEPEAGKCWDDDECEIGQSCMGASVCPCGAACNVADSPGVCMAPTTDWNSCSSAGECVLAADSCCGTCGAPSASSMDAVRYDATAAHYSDVCPDPTSGCPDCAQSPNPDLAAFCEIGFCKVVEVSKHPVSACSSDSDCTLAATTCCACGEISPFETIALANDGVALYEAQICPPNAGACAPCVPTFDSTLTATCDDTGHCRVAQGSVACPQSPPVQGADCAPGGPAVCEYGEDLRIGCRMRATCENNQWQTPVTGCAPIGTAGHSGCPSSTSAEGSVCSQPGITCDMGNGASCECLSCAGGACPIDPIPLWQCASAPSDPCPERAPNTGRACELEGVSCSYGIACSSTGTQRTCSGGVWQEDLQACPL
jgi:hypothetical protein